MDEPEELAGPVQPRHGRRIPERLRLVLDSVASPLETDKTQVISVLIDTVAQSLGAWFRSAAFNLGAKLIVDQTSCSVALQLLGRSLQDDHLLAYSRSLYGGSLQALQKALNHPTEWKTPETLFAAIALCHYELFEGTTTPNSWMKHAAGVSRLIENRGPESFNNDWDKSMLLAFRPVIIVNDISSGKNCYLAQDRWQPLMRHDQPSQAVTMANMVFKDEVRIVDDYTQIFAKVPTILRGFYAARHANRSGRRPDANKVMLLMRTAARVRNELVDWYRRYLMLDGPPVEVPATDPRSIYPTVLAYSNPWKGSRHMSYWASMIVVNGCLRQCFYHEDFSEANALYASNIFRSIENVSEGTMGPLRCAYPVRVAFEIADDETKAYVRRWMGTLGQRYAATAIYDETSLDEFESRMKDLQI